MNPQLVEKRQLTRDIPRPLNAPWAPRPNDVMTLLDVVVAVSDSTVWQDPARSVIPTQPLQKSKGLALRHVRILCKQRHLPVVQSLEISKSRHAQHGSRESKLAATIGLSGSKPCFFFEVQALVQKGMWIDAMNSNTSTVRLTSQKLRWTGPRAEDVIGPAEGMEAQRGSLGHLSHGMAGRRWHVYRCPAS